MSNHNKKKASNIVLFSLDEPRYALYLSAVERVIHSVEITPLPKAPDKVLGVINIQGEVIPVIDITDSRSKFRRSVHHSQDIKASCCACGRFSGRCF